jgi:hypothetical protein
LYARIKNFGPDSAEYAATATEQAEIKQLKKELKCVVGWSMQSRITKELVLDALLMVVGLWRWPICKVARSKVVESKVPAEAVCL